MKNKEIVLPVCALIFSALFYGHQAGINFLLFSILLTLLIIYLHPEKLKDTSWWFYCACTLCTALAIVIVNSDLSIFAWIISVLVFSNKSVFTQYSTILNGAFAAYSIITSPVNMGINIHRYFNEKDNLNKEHNKKIALAIIVAAAVSLVFLFLYMGSNPLFNKFIMTFNLNWLDTGWVLFTVFGLFVIYGLIYTRSLNFFSDFDRRAIHDIPKEEEKQPGTWPATAIIAIVLFSILNGMLLIINCLDFYSIYVAQKLPEGITLSDFVHDAVSATIASIVIGVCLIAWIFNGELNFSRYGKLVKLLAHAWIAQNALVLISTLTRNYWYVQQYHLTHLRIGVYVFLALAFCGLFLTNRKINDKKSYWWLLTSNVQVWFVVIVCSSFLNWDKLVTQYNINRSGPGKKLDKEYILGLSDANIPELVKLNNQGAFNREQKIRLYKKVLHTYHKNNTYSWQGYSMRDSKNTRSLLEIRL